MKTAISIPDPLFEAAESLAKQLGLSRSELFQHAVREYVQAHGRPDVTQTLNRVYAAGRNTARLDSALAKLQAASLPDEEW